MSKSKTSSSASIEEVTWEKIRDQVAAVNPELCHIIDKISPSQSLTLFKARYFFGDEIIRKGRLYLPCKDIHLHSQQR